MIIQLRKKSLYSTDDKNKGTRQYSSSNRKDNTEDQININNNIKNNNFIKNSTNDNVFSIFNHSNNIDFVDGQNSAVNDVNNMGFDNFGLSKEEFAETENGAENRTRDGNLEEKDKAECIIKGNFM